jgi:hypothetical protein
MLGRVLLAAMVISGCTSGVASPRAGSARDLTGEWIGTYRVGSISGPITMSLRQAGSSVTGVVTATTACGPGGSLTGELSGRSFQWSGGCLSGLFWVDGNTMEGRMQGATVTDVRMTRSE